MAQRIFLGSRKLLPTAIAEKLIGQSNSSLPDLSSVLLVLPGKVARRNVREQLLKLSPDGVLLPQMLTPGQLMHYESPAASLPGPADELLWGKALKRALRTPERFPALFPDNRIPADPFAAGLILSSLRRELSAGGFSIADCAVHFGERGPQLAELEKFFLDELEKYGFTDPLECDRQAIENIDIFGDISKIILAGVPDLPRMLQKKLAAADEKFPGKIEIWIGMSEDKADCCDDWGVPLPEKWNDLAFDCDPETLHVANDPADCARKAISLCSSDGKLDTGKCAVVLADFSLYRDFAAEFSELRTITGKAPVIVDPSGIPYSAMRTYMFGQKLLDYFCSKDDFLTAVNLLRHEDCLKFFAGNFADTEQLLEALDNFVLSYCQDTLSGAIKIAESQLDSGKPLIPGKHLIALKRIFIQIKTWRQEAESLPPAEFLRKIFTDIYRNISDQAPSPGGVTFAVEHAFLNDLLRELDKLPEALIRDTDNLQILEFFFRQCKDAKVPVAIPDDAITFEGRLEMPFLTAERLVFCGMNEEYFPDKIDQDAFLTDSLRRRIGIRSNRETLARSRYHLFNTQEPRTANDLHVIVLRRDYQKAALRPSGILFGGEGISDKRILDRCTYLFKDPYVLQKNYPPPGNNIFTLVPEINFRRDQSSGNVYLAVTDLDRYLQGAFYFFWEKVLKINKKDYLSWEISSADAGTFCHRAIELLGKRRFPSETALYDELTANFRQIIHTRYGKELPVLISITAENMLQRLKPAAAILYKEQIDGFEVLATEYSFGGESNSVEFCGAIFSGKVDRIEYNSTTKTIRIIDIKTGKVEKDAASDHYTENKGTVTFKKLQLLLYAILLRQDAENFKKLCPDFDHCRMECAYLHMPQIVENVKLHLWEADDLERIILYANQKVYESIAEIHAMARGFIHQDPEKIKNPLLLPDAATAVSNVKWIFEKKDIETSDSTADKTTVAIKISLPSNPPVAGERNGKPLPVVKEKKSDVLDRCCRCPQQRQEGCQCSGECLSCKSFNGFKPFNIINASAGTGKTYSLASRFIQLMDFGAEPENILAITFTRKAAGEIFDKLVSRLCNFILDRSKAQNCCRRMPVSRVMELIHKLLGPAGSQTQISTIDSFFLRLFKAYAPELGIWGKINMLDENDDTLKREILRSWLTTLNRDVLPELRELLKEADISESRGIYASLNEIVDNAYAFYRQKVWQDSNIIFPQLRNIPWDNPADRLTAGEVRKNAQTLRNLIDDKCDNQTMCRQLYALAEFIERCADNGLTGTIPQDVKELFKKLNTYNRENWINEDNHILLYYSKNVTFPPAINDILRKLLRHIFQITIEHRRLKTLATLGMMRTYDHISLNKIRRSGTVTFNDLTAILVSSGIMEHSGGTDSPAMRLDAETNHYLFDEFQDTSDFQFKVFQPLFDELFSQINTERFRSFFSVGDIKQSIYLWREGNPKLFDRLETQLKPIGDALNFDPCDTLIKSYRSSQMVLDTVNAVFREYTTGEMGFVADAVKMMKFQPHISNDPEKSGFAALLSVPKSKTFAEKARVVAKLLTDIKPFERGMSVGILFRKNDEARQFADELRAIGDFPVSVEGKISPVDSMAFQVFKELLILSEHPGDDEAVKFLSMLSFAPSGTAAEPMTPAQLAEKLNFETDIPLSQSIRKDIFINKLAGFARRFYNAFAADCTAFDRRRIEILVNAASIFDGSVQDFIRRSEKLGEEGKALDNTIQLMTFHKSKGLEFDIVFIPGVNQSGGSNKSSTPDAEINNTDTGKYENNSDLPQWVSFLPPIDLCRSNRKLKEHCNEKSLKSAFEYCCMLYVAMTRAKHALYMIFDEYKKTMSFSVTNFVYEQLSEYGYRNDDLVLNNNFAEDGIHAKLVFSHGDRNWYIREKGEAVVLEENILQLPQLIFASETGIHRASDQSEHSAVAPEKRFIPVSGMNTGTGVHEILSAITFIDDDFDEKAFCNRFTEFSAAVRNIVCCSLAPGSAIREMLKDPGGETEVWREKAFILKNSRNQQVSGAFDRVVIFREKGKITGAEIYDYKSDNIATTDGFDIYFPQLISYRQSLAILLNIPENMIQCRICALKLNAVIDIDQPVKMRF